MIKKVHLLALTFGALLTLSACSKVTVPDSPAEEEKGHFKISFTNMSASASMGAGSRAFWETDETKRTDGEVCERQLNNVSIFVYADGSNDCIYRRNFTAHELEKKTAVFSLPEGKYEHDKTYDFYAVANFKYGADADLPSRSDLVAATQSDLGAYMGMTTGANAATDSVGKFNSIYSTISGDAKALRDNESTGSGFVMSSPMVSADVPDGDKPRSLELQLARLVGKTEVKAYTTELFKTNYIIKYGSTLKIDTIKIANVPTKSFLIAASSIAAIEGDYKTMYQIPGIETVSDVEQYYSVIYGFENNITASAPSKKPELRISATYDFDGDPATQDDITKITYKKELALSGTGAMLRNTFYQVEVKINGLTAQEIVTTIKVLPWNTVAVEEIEFGQ